MRRANAVTAALAQAAFSGHVCDAPLAKWFLPGPLRWVAFALNAVPSLLRLANRIADWIWPGRFSYVACRTAYVDDAVERALARGVRQVVILGAGLDSRSWRYPNSRAQFFELDRQDVQRQKRAALRRTLIESVLFTRPRFVAADLETDDLAAALTGAGFDPSAPAVFVWEHAEQLHRNLPSLLALAAPGSELVGGVSANADETAALIADSGWQAEDIASSDELRRRFLGNTPLGATSRTPSKPRTVGRWSRAPAIQMQQRAA